MPYLKAFRYGLLGGLIGSVPGLLVWNLGALESLEVLLLLSPFILFGSAAGLILGRMVTLPQARSWGVLPGVLVGACLPLAFPTGSAWYPFIIAPTLASGASCYVLALALSRRSIDPPPQASP